jgi:hypothetical protein
MFVQPISTASTASWALKDPWWRKPNGAEQPSLVRIVADGSNVNLDLFGLQDDRSTADREFVDAPRAIQGWLGHRSITSTAVYTALAPNRFKDFWRD